MFDISAIDLSALLPFILVGFAAQLIDGAIGMAFGVITSTLLVGVLGIPPAQASARVNLVAFFTSGVSGLSHILHRNVDAKLFLNLVVPGVIGGILGATLVSYTPSDIIKPIVLVYLVGVGLWIFWRGLDHQPQIKDAKIVKPLGLIGGFLSGAGGGGWGPVVTSNLLVQGAEPRKVIGTVNTAEFVLTLSISLTFLGHLGMTHFGVAVLGLLIGGVAAAPLGAFLAKRVPAKPLLIMVGIVLTLTSLYGLNSALS